MLALQTAHTGSQMPNGELHIILRIEDTGNEI